MNKDKIDFANALSVNIGHLESINNTLPMLMLLIQPFHKKADTELKAFLDTSVEKETNVDGDTIVMMKLEDLPKYDGLQKNLAISGIANKVVPESLFVSMISQYDAFLGRLLKAIFLSKPELLNSSEKNLTFSQIMEIGGIEDARDFIMEKEIDAVIRDSHSEQFNYLEKKLGIQLRKDLTIWSDFIEITERRNLFVHCDGYISRQYLQNCKSAGIDISKISLGDRISVPHDYFIKTYKVLYELAVKLTHTVWRKLKINDLENADAHLNNTCYGLIETKQFDLTDNLLHFACGQKKHSNDANKNVFVINRALSKYLQDKKKEAKKLIDEKDWSASSDNFRLASFALTENDEAVFALMRKIGNNNEVKKDEYKMWPLFYALRKKESFREVFKEIFKEDYTVCEKPLLPVQEFIKDFSKNKDLNKLKTHSRQQPPKSKSKLTQTADTSMPHSVQNK